MPMQISRFKKTILAVILVGMMGGTPFALAKSKQNTDDDFKPDVTLKAKSEALVISDDISTAEAQLLAHPDDPEAHFLVAAAYSRSPQYVIRAYEHIQKVKQLLKTQHNFEFIDEKIGEYQGMLKDQPNDSVLMYRLALAYYFRGYAMERHPERFKENPLGGAQDYYDAAKDLADKVIKMNPKDIAARNYLGYMVYDKDHNVNKAIQIWKESLAVTEDNPGAYFLLGQAYLKTGDLKNAMVYGAKGLAMQQQMGIKGL